MVAQQPTLMRRLSWLCNLIFHQCVAVISVFIIWTCGVNYTFKFTEDYWIFWHVLLSSIAYVPLMGEAIILFGSENSWTAKINRRIRYFIHGIFLFVSAILVTIGVALVLKERNDEHGAHFTTTHAWTGFASWVLVLLSQFLGLASAYAQSLKNIVKPVYVKLAHNLLGQLGYVFGIVSLCYGMNYSLFKGYASEESVTASWYVMGFITFWSLLAAFKSCYAQVQAILS